MEKLARNISEKISVQLNQSEEKKDVIAYGLTAIFQLLVIGIIISLIGTIFNFLYESLVVFLCVALIKKSTGGAHSYSIYTCTYISIFTISLFAFLARYVLSLSVMFYIDISAIIIIYTISCLIFYKKVPVDSQNKPITKPEKIKTLRKQSFFILILYFLSSTILFYFGVYKPRFFSISFSIQLAVLWQTFMLTKLGANFISIIDSYLLRKKVYEK